MKLTQFMVYANFIWHREWLYWFGKWSQWHFEVGNIEVTYTDSGSQFGIVVRESGQELACVWVDRQPSGPSTP